MLKALKKHHISFKHAFDGVVYAFSTQPNFRIHISLALIAIIFGFVFRITYIEMIIIVFTIILGLTVEMINTSIEAVSDLVSNKWSTEAKIAKDVSAGMMLIVAVGAILISVIIFLPKILNFIF
jgi:diacylglycerol kinase